MMRAFYAMGRDSFREAKDRKISRILEILSVGVALIVFALGFKETEPKLFLERTLAGAHGPIGSQIRVAKVEKRTSAGQGATFEAELALVERHVETSLSDDARDEIVSQNVRRAFESRNLRLDSIRQLPARAGDPQYAVAYGYSDRLDVPGLMKLSLAWVTEVDLDLGAQSGEPGFALSARLFIAGFEAFIARYIAGWVGVIIAIIATAGFVPSMLQGGTAHLLLSKPNPRAVLFLGKYFGGVAFVLYHAMLLSGLFVLALFIRTGWLDTRFLLVGPILAALFAIVYAISCVAAVLLETPVVSVLAAIGFWCLCFAIAFVKHDLPMMPTPTGEKLEIPAAVTRGIDVVYWILPKTNDLSTLVAKVVGEGRETPELARMVKEAGGAPKVEYGKSAASSALFTAALLGLGCLVFSRRDY